MAKLTVKDLLAAKGTTPLVEVFVRNPKEAQACEEAGIEMLVAAELHEGQTSDYVGIRKAAPNTFVTIGIAVSTYAGTTEVLRAAYRMMNHGADAIYCGYGFDAVEALANEHIPVVGHVGLVPYRNTWFGGMKAVGKTADEALEIWELTKRYEDAGAIAVEMEVVPTPVATEITKRTKMLVIGMGAGPHCDVQYLFSTDVLGDNEHKVPRHSKVYRDFKSEYARLYKESVAAFTELRHDVRSGAYPTPQNEVSIGKAEYERFLSGLK
jgi:3-methyl-2-oxobutanoate hydroxymethyltransferase